MNIDNIMRMKRAYGRGQAWGIKIGQGRGLLSKPPQSPQSQRKAGVPVSTAEMVALLAKVTGLWGGARGLALALRKGKDCAHAAWLHTPSLPASVISGSIHPVLVSQSLH